MSTARREEHAETERDQDILSVEEALQEAMNTPATRNVECNASRGRHDVPEPHLPLRKASAERLRSTHAPRRHHYVPVQHGSKGFHPKPVEPMPSLAAVNASSEHAFAGKDMRRPSRLPLGSIALGRGRDETQRSAPSTASAGDRPPSPLLPPSASPYFLDRNRRGSRSLGEGLRGLKERLSSQHRAIPTRNGGSTPSSNRPSMAIDPFRQSFRSVLTGHSSYMNASSVNTECSSLATGNSSPSELVHPQIVEPDLELEGSVTNEVDDIYDAYAGGFESGKQSMDTMYAKRSFQVERSKPSMDFARDASLPMERPATSLEIRSTQRPQHRRSQSASLLLAPKTTSAEDPQISSEPRRTQTSSKPIETRLAEDTRPTTSPPHTNKDVVPRDRYGFKKASHYISVEQYDAWDAIYSEHLARRSKKWHALMRSYGLNTDRPYRFPPKSEKIKRYVRKGIPPELRGAAWFWYAHGPTRIKNQPDLYASLLRQVENGKLSDNDREHIERDLNRTFPDNERFKPDTTITPSAEASVGANKKRRATMTEVETPVVQALRRVLQAFAVHNPGIGYCQSLNFIAGLLLLFLDEDEEKAFILLEVVTSEHLPGTHGVALEGANIDIAVLMNCIQDSMPQIWDKLDDKGNVGLVGDATAQTLRLPTVSLATTAWFMSLFVGTLPIESVLRVWDCLFFEGSKTLFRVALAIFRAGERDILKVSDPMEIFQVVQTIPRKMLDINGLMACAFGRPGASRAGRRGGFGHVTDAGTVIMYYSGKQLQSAVQPHKQPLAPAKMDVNFESEDEDPRTAGLLAVAKNFILHPFRLIVSRTAQKAYLTTFLLIATVLILFAFAVIAYTLFYLSYIPRIGFERTIYLQFDNVYSAAAANGPGLLASSAKPPHPYPYGTVSLAPDMVGAQQYDVAVELVLPRTPANTEVGNFMVEVSMFAPAEKGSTSMGHAIMDTVHAGLAPGSTNAPKMLATSRRSAILPYRSQLIELACKATELHWYLLGFRQESEKLKVAMFERISFPTGWKHVPATMKVELQSESKMQVYAAKATFRARFRGLRWLMYNHRIISAVIFISGFWLTETVFASLAWFIVTLCLLSSPEDVKAEEVLEVADRIKQEPGDSVPPTPKHSETERTFPTSSSQQLLRYSSPRIKHEDDEGSGVFLMQESHAITPAAEADDEDEEADFFLDSGIGTSMDSASTRQAESIRRRRGRMSLKEKP
ncbi:Domain in Tre-2, BUB2p, and Cdc16p putative Rab-GAPs [Teratosphaeria destructans]|uniref:Domain in Tre-2, BUB2p, and Cdc16p putative Rab-GAPs n=1 Tax=Teratosphaeria destructans TaxID=418781 RepID=A0A9W7VYQ2_9PEZI|nr:Domain in Tre-2, BUB2p, and Cdc16p putative Rab-GAPs [Teratosphaeria destructans]